jgi:hypothetical protein
MDWASSLSRPDNFLIRLQKFSFLTWLGYRGLMVGRGKGP